VGDELARKLDWLSIRTIGDLITNFPRRYDDYSNVLAAKNLRPGSITIEAKIGQVSSRYVRRGLHITEAIASDSTGSVRLVWFNQPYRAGAIKHGQAYFVAGEYGLRRGRFSILNPSVELVNSFPVNTARIIPIYREVKGLRSLTIRKLIREAIQNTGELEDHLPEWLIKRNKLVSYAAAVAEVHFHLLPKLWLPPSSG
jgi:ATP-dependent DNA helicase RecG